MKNKLNYGFSLIEIMVVITIFAVLGIIVTSSIILTLAGTKKSEALIRVRDNLNYSLAVIERNIRNANSIPVSGCTGIPSDKISYLDENGSVASFSCVQDVSGNYIMASGSSTPASRITSNTIKVTSCSFTCTPTESDSPPLVTIDLTVQDASSSGVQSAQVTATTQIQLRNY